MNRKKQAVTVAVDYLGCKLNQAEMQELAGELAAVGFTLVGPDEPADIYVLNTCTVTHIADRKSRQLLRQARRRNPSARLIAIGCYAERAAQELRAIEGVELVLGNTQKRDLVRLLEGKKATGATELPPGTHTGEGRTRSFLRVQDGCHNYCAYCIVPLVRSTAESVAAERIIERIQGLLKAGYREIVLTGTEIGTYRDGETGLAGLIERILSETAIERLRLSSLQPPELTPDLIALWRDARLCPHFHISLQSGADSVLRRMKRRYDTAAYRQAVERIRAIVPDAAITTDIIVGFPGETDEEYAASEAFCREIRFARIHVFPYSARPGTAAANMPGQVADAVKKERSKRMLDLGKGAAAAFAERFLNTTADVLMEQASGGYWNGLTGNYIKVYVRTDKPLANRIIPVRLEKTYRDGVLGKSA